ncbi:TPA: hypothetical protein N2G45_002890 [Salmonella enterica]|nr:hypothetical protein [Salmonella enterica]
MATKGIKQVRENFKKLTDKITGSMTEQTIMAILIEGGTAAAAITPRDTSTLVNSMYRKITPLPKGMMGRVGYAASYALWVNDAPGKLKGQPRAHFGKTRAGAEFGGGTGKGEYWDPHAEPGFLKKGFERDAMPAIKKIIREGYQL